MLWDGVPTDLFNVVGVGAPLTASFGSGFFSRFFAFEAARIGTTGVFCGLAVVPVASFV